MDECVRREALMALIYIFSQTIIYIKKVQGNLYKTQLTKIFSLIITMKQNLFRKITYICIDARAARALTPSVYKIFSNVIPQKKVSKISTKPDWLECFDSQHSYMILQFLSNFLFLVLCRARARTSPAFSFWDRAAIFFFK